MWLIFVVFIKDCACKLVIVIKEIGERNEKVPTAIIYGNLSLTFVLLDSFVLKVLNEVGEVFADVSSQTHFTFFEFSLHAFNFLKLLF